MSASLAALAPGAGQAILRSAPTAFNENEMPLPDTRRGLMWSLSTTANFLLAWKTRALTAPMETPRCAAMSRFDNSAISRSSIALRIRGLNCRIAADKICASSLCK